MIDKSIGFIGGGRITRIFLEGWARSKAIPARVTVSDPNWDTLGRLNDRFPSIACTSDNLKAAAQEVVFLAVHPPAMAEAAALLKGALGTGALVVSLAPKFTIAKLAGLMGGFDRIARVIPNAPSIMGEGFNPVAYSPELSAQDRSALNSLLAPLGQYPETAEAKLEAYAILSGMGPTYFWFQLQALREVSADFGLSGPEIAAAMESMVSGAARTLLGSGMAPAEVMDLIPVKPLAEMEAQVAELYRSRLPALYAKIKP
jgi:pyrroline-5-carboxylate reductase